MTSFDDSKATQELISSIALVKLIKDFKLENGLNTNLIKEQAMRTAKGINQYLLHKEGDMLSLDYVGFQHFLL